MNAQSPVSHRFLHFVLLAALVAAPACSSAGSKSSNSSGTGAAAGGAAANSVSPGAGATAAAPAATATPMGDADPKAATIAKQLTDAMGGVDAWNNMPYFRFDFVVMKEGKEMARFKHYWDKKNGMDRVEGPDEKGHTVVTMVGLKDRKGTAYVDGAKQDSAAAAPLVENGYDRWVNDTYWVMMPFKLRDPGTHLKYDKTVTEGGNTYDVLSLTFDKGVGLTSDDHYWLYINQKTHMIDKWQYLLTGQKPPASTAMWVSWTPVGPVKLSLERHMMGKPVMLKFDNAAAPQTMDPAVFTSPKPAS